MHSITFVHVYNSGLFSLGNAYGCGRPTACRAHLPTGRRANLGDDNGAGLRADYQVLTLDRSLLQTFVSPLPHYSDRRFDLQSARGVNGAPSTLRFRGMAACLAYTTGTCS